MTDDQIQNLFYLVHDKSHITAPGETCSLVDTLFTDDAITAPDVSLYRGLCKHDVTFLEEMQRTGSMFKTYPGYLSMTETLSVAKRFAVDYKTKNLIHLIKPRLEAPRGINMLGILDPLIDRDDEGELGMLDTIKKEREWIFRQPRVVIKRVDQRDGYRIWKIKLITL